MRLAAANFHIILNLLRPVNCQIGLDAFPRTQCRRFFAVMASQASPTCSHDSTRREVFLRRPPQPFDRDCERDVRSRNHDTDKDWLPEVKDIITGNFHLMIDMTGDSEGEDETESSSRYPGSDLGTYPAVATPSRLKSVSSGQRLSGARQLPRATDIVDSELAKIKKSPGGAVQVPPVASGPSDRCDDRYDSSRLAPITAITEAVVTHIEEDSVVECHHQSQHQDQEKEEQEQEELDNDGGTYSSRSQPKAPILTSPIQVLVSSLTSARRGPEAKPGYCPQTQTARPTTSPASGIICTESGPCIGIQNITFLRVEDQREAADGPEYQFVAKIWLQPGAGIPSNLVYSYIRDVARQTRLSTSRTRTRMSEKAGVAKVKLCKTRKKTG